MSQFDFSSNLSLGQYEPLDTPVHRLVPALKMLSVILLGSAVLFSPLFPQLLLLFLFFCLIGWMGNLKIRYLMKGIRPILPFLLLIGVIQIFFISRQLEGDPLFSVWIFKIYREDLFFTARLFARFFCLVLLLSIFTSVTPVTEISHGTEALLKPFGRKQALAHDMSLVVTITFRFIPILAREAEHITKAQASRGASFGTWNMGLLKKIRLYIPLIIPLFIAALERSEILVEAMESRCYEAGARRTRLDEFHWKFADWMVLFLIIVIFSVLFLSRIL